MGALVAFFGGFGAAASNLVLGLVGSERDASGSDGDDNIQGGTENDVLAGGAGNNTISGGANTDTVNYSQASAGVSVSLDGVANDGVVSVSSLVLSRYDLPT